MTGTLEENDISSRDEKLAEFMEFLPRYLCIRLLIVEDASGLYMGMSEILYVGITADEVIDVRDTMFSDAKTFLHSANYQRYFGKVEERVAEKLEKWHSPFDNPLSGTVGHTIAKLKLQPQPYVGLWQKGSTVVECEASDPRFMFFFALQAARIEMMIEKLHSAKDLHKGVRRDVQALEHLQQRFNAFVTKSYHASLVPSSQIA